MKTQVTSYGTVASPQSPASQPPWLTAVLEDLERVGFSVLQAAIAEDTLGRMRVALDRLLSEQSRRFGGETALSAIGESGQIRAVCNEDPLFWELVTHTAVVAIVERLLGSAAIVMQQNGVVMPGGAKRHEQQRWHRDLPYQTWVSSTPLALGVLCALDPFTAESGATTFLPGSHRFALFPSDRFIQQWEHQVQAPAGSLIVFDAMVFHRGSINTGKQPRRAVNTLFGVPLLAQQVTIEPPDGASDLIVRRSGVIYRPAQSADDYRARRGQRLSKRGEHA